LGTSIRGRRSSAGSGAGRRVDEQRGARLSEAQIPFPSMLPSEGSTPSAVSAGLPRVSAQYPALLRASNIVPWAECDDDAHRLDVYNGLLLSALWDAAFDAGKISFADDGEVLFHPSLGATERNLVLANAAARLKGLAPKHIANLERHRKRSGF
jgi:hypothetical protein